MGLPGQSNGLIAVLLITRSRPGPKLVFHYPTKPQSTRDHVDADDSDEESDEETAGDPHVRIGHHNSGINSHSVNAELQKISLDHIEDSESERILGYRIDSLEKLLSPGRWSDRKKFEVCVDEITFVGQPIYADEEGKWSKKQVDRQVRGDVAGRTVKASTEHLRTSTIYEADAATENAANVTIAGPDTLEQVTHNFTHMPESLDSQLGLSFATSMNSTSTASAAVREQMTMFQVVFAIRYDGHNKVSDMYQQVIKTFSKALHYCQKQTNYVAAESARLLAISAKAKQAKLAGDALLTQMLEGSELAWALKEVYDRISAGEIAGIRLSGLELSLQLSPAEDTINDDHDDLGPHLGLLLLEDNDVLLRELSHPEASPLAYFIREQTPTKSLQKHSTNLNLPVSDVLYLAQHLITWRKAKAITPLHPRNIYTTLPDAPTDKVPVLMQMYRRKFPALPSLPQILKMLSGKPIQYGLLIPSKDHRAPYMEILAFLVRHGFVGQLKTYGWLRAQSSTDRRDEHAKPERPKYQASGMSLLSPQLRPSEDDNASVSSEQTAIQIVDAKVVDESTSMPGSRQDIVLNPANPTDDDALILEHMWKSVEPDFQERHTRLLPYLDGEHALEEIAALEVMKRSSVEEWIGVLHRSGHLITFRSL